MKALLVIAAVAAALAGCSMPRRDSGSMPAQGASQPMGSMSMSGDQDRWMYDEHGRPWNGGDGVFFGAQNM